MARIKSRDDRLVCMYVCVRINFETYNESIRTIEFILRKNEIDVPIVNEQKLFHRSMKKKKRKKTREKKGERKCASDFGS